MTCAEYLTSVRNLPCSVCLSPPPNSAHHCIMGRFSQLKSSDFDAIPLCPAHHMTEEGKLIGLHHSPQEWRDWYGTDTDYIAQTRRMILGPDWRLYSIRGGLIIPITTEGATT